MEQVKVDFTTFHSRLWVRGTLTADTALRIGTGGAGGATELDLPVVKDLAGLPYIPGSSLKGVLRSHVESLLRAWKPELACLCTSKPQTGSVKGCLTQEQVSKLKQESKSAGELSHRLIDESCWTCRLFGAPWLASKVLIRDLPVVSEAWFGHYLARQGVAIDRDTETAGEGLLYDFEAVPPGTRFHFEMVVENADLAEQGLIMLGVRELEKGRISLGGGRSRGLGRVTLETDWQASERVDSSTLKRYLATGEGESLGDEEARAVTLNAFLEAVEVKEDAQANGE